MSLDRLERSLPGLFDELADERTPDYYHDLFLRTARLRQRPAWTLRERWLPMLEIARQPVVAQPPWRAFGLLLLLIAAVATGLILAATRPKPPPPFGPAGNGLVVLSRDGDILTSDPRSGVTTPRVTGPEIDRDPVWSHDGATLLFRRESPGVPGADHLMVARADGSGLLQLTREPMTGLIASKVDPSLAPKLHYALSPDGSTVAMIATVGGIPAMYVADTAGRAISQLDVHAMPLSIAFDPTGTDILFVGALGLDASYAGLYIVGADGTNLRTLVEPQLDAPVHSRAVWSPDGTQVAYARWEPNVGGVDMGFGDDRGIHADRSDLRIHVMSADGMGDRIVGHQDGAWWEAPTAFSPDGRRLLIERNLVSDAEGAPFVAVIVDVDGRAPDLVPQFESAEDWFASWSPDGTKILATPGVNSGGLQQQLWDTRTGEAEPAPWAAASYPSWQRVAP